MFFKRGFLVYFLIFSGKHLCWSLFWPAILLKRDPNTVVSWKYYEIFKNSFFKKHLWTAASENTCFFYRVFVLPGPRSFAWSPTLTLAPGPDPQFVFTVPDPQFVFTGPGPQVVFIDPGTKFLFTGPGPHLVFTPNLYLPAKPGAWVCIYRPCLPNLYLLVLAYDLFAHRLLNWFTHNDAE